MSTGELLRRLARGSLKKIVSKLERVESKENKNILKSDKADKSTQPSNSGKIKSYKTLLSGLSELPDGCRLNRYWKCGERIPPTIGRTIIIEPSNCTRRNNIVWWTKILYTWTSQRQILMPSSRQKKRSIQWKSRDLLKWKIFESRTED